MARQKTLMERFVDCDTKAKGREAIAAHCKATKADPTRFYMTVDETHVFSLLGRGGHHLAAIEVDAAEMDPEHVAK